MNDPQIVRLKEEIALLKKQIRQLVTLTYRSEATGGVVSCLYADLPSANITGKMAFVTNGRKSGEGAGAGTGVLAVVAMLGGTLQWCNADDNSQAVQI